MQCQSQMRVPCSSALITPNQILRCGRRSIPKARCTRLNTYTPLICCLTATLILPLVQTLSWRVSCPSTTDPTLPPPLTRPILTLGPRSAGPASPTPCSPFGPTHPGLPCSWPHRYHTPSPEPSPTHTPPGDDVVDVCEQRVVSAHGEPVVLPGGPRPRRREVARLAAREVPRRRPVQHQPELLRADPLQP